MNNLKWMNRKKKKNKEEIFPLRNFFKYSEFLGKSLSCNMINYFHLFFLKISRFVIFLIILNFYIYELISKNL